MSVASKLITIAENLQAKLDAINVKLTAKGQTEATNLNEVPDKIEAIETGADVSNVTATASDVLSPKIIVDASGTEQTGTIVTKTSSNLTASGATVTVPAGYYASDTSKSVATATQATPSISISSSGLITASATQSAGYVSSGTKSATKQLSTKSATTYTPRTSNQTISSGYYLTGTQTIKGDSNLVASNIKSGVSIFGVSGSYSGGSGSIGSYVSSTPTNSGTNLTFTIDNIDNAIGFFIGHYSYISPSGSHDLDYILSVFIPNDASTNAGTSRYVSTLSNDGRAYRLIETDDTFLGYLKLGNSLMLIANTPDMFIFSPNANYYCYPIYGS